MILQNLIYSNRSNKKSLSLIIYKSKFFILQQIRDIQETDAGYYQCSINLNLMTSINAKVELKVRRPPIISDNSSQSVIVNEKDPVYLECYASGYPTPRISWRRENNAVLPTGNSVHRSNNNLI